MKKIFILLLIVLSFSLTSCRRVKFESFENEVDWQDFENGFYEEYGNFKTKLREQDFEYQCIYKTTSIKMETSTINNLKSSFKQDLDNNLFEFTEKGTENNVRTNYKDVKVNTKETYFLEDGKLYIKKEDGEINEYRPTTEYLYENKCRMSFALDLLRTVSKSKYSYYIDGNKYTQVFDGEDFGSEITERKQMIFNENVVTVWWFSLMQSSETTFITEVKMVFDFKDVKL